MTILPDVPAFRAELRRKLVTKRRGFLFVAALAGGGVTVGGLWAQIVCLVIAGAYLMMALDQTAEIRLLSSGDPD